MHSAELQIPDAEMPALDLGLFASPCCSLLQFVGVSLWVSPSREALPASLPFSLRLSLSLASGLLADC